MNERLKVLNFKYNVVVFTFVFFLIISVLSPLSGLDWGSYVKGSQGGMTNLDVFTFSAGEAYKVENGKLGEKVRDLTLTGNIFDTMNRIDAIGNDLIMYNSGGSGGCGKAGQAPLPIGRGGPHLVIRDVIVGGR